VANLEILIEINKVAVKEKASLKKEQKKTPDKCWEL